jgi:TPR repeat protein
MNLGGNFGIVGTPQDFRRAMACFKAASDKGHAGAMYQLAGMIANGQGALRIHHWQCTGCRLRPSAGTSGLKAIWGSGWSSKGNPMKRCHGSAELQHRAIKQLPPQWRGSPPQCSATLQAASTLDTPHTG